MSLPIKTDKSGNSVWESSRELRLRYKIGVEKLKIFFESLQKGKLMATKCVSCGKQYFPPQIDCPGCGGSGKWYKVARKGRLITYTKILVKPSSFQNLPDYIVGVAKMEDGTNLMAWVDADLDEVEVGQTVELVVDGGEVIYKLRPVNPDE